MSISEDLAAEILVRSARHCCICRRFRPLHLQVHHIIEKRNEGSDEVDNLIPICVSCHSDVHSGTTLTRRFSVEELKRHRDAVFALVAEGRLPASEVSREAVESITARLVKEVLSNAAYSKNAVAVPSTRAVDLLLASVCEDAPIRFALSEDGFGFTIVVGQRLYLREREGEEETPRELESLVSLGLFRQVRDGFRPTSRGIAMVDDLVPLADLRFSLVKAKCLSCSLHFILCTWNVERHSAGTLICPECGQNRGKFLVWRQREFGSIFQHVPGRAGDEHVASLLREESR